jgi:amino acid transporter
MRPLGWIGALLVIAGVIVVVMRGIPYTKSRSDVEVGPIKVTAKEQGIVPPYVGIIAIVAGGVLVFAGRKRSA